MNTARIHKWIKPGIVAVIAIGGLLFAAGAVQAKTAPQDIQYGSSTIKTCSKKTIKSNYRGDCGKVLQKRLKDLGFYSGKIDGIVGTGTLNAVLNYQRAQHLSDDAITGPNTWTRLAKNPQLKVANPVPKGCKTKGRVACVSKAQRTATFYKDGKAVKTIKVRIGGWTEDSKGNMRVHHTVKGTYKVFNKDPNPSSKRYGEGAMPLSVMFDPNMYFHYSADFAAYGYARSSHGCVNIGSKSQAKWVYNFMKVGDKVIVY